MKKISIIGIIALFAVVFATLTEAAEWKKERMENGVNYSTTDAGIFCAVFVPDKGGIGVVGLDSTISGIVAAQEALINSDGNIHSMGIWTRSTVYDHDGSYSYETVTDDSGYWVFSAKCVEAAKDLPVEVRSRFKGAFGIE